MTPLAHRIVKELTKPEKRRRFEDHAGLARDMGDVHCFDCTEISELVGEMRLQFADMDLLELPTTFLPAPRTWIEAYVSEAEERRGVLLEDMQDGTFRVRVGIDQTSNRHLTGFFSVAYAVYIPLTAEGTDKVRWEPSATADTAEPPQVLKDWYANNVLVDIYTYLAFINTPRVIGRRQHRPHQGLSKKLSGVRGTVGPLSLNNWTEIVLDVAPPASVDTDESGQRRLTGRKALHFCRSHLRVRKGRLEQVRAHWRGDAAQGVRRQRYRVEKSA